ncbi:hypothetical protein Tco_0900467 [Tanacetum coccineum]
MESLNSNSQEGETVCSKSAKERSLDYATKDVQAIKHKMSKAKERCMTYFRSLHSHLQVLSNEDLKGTHTEHGFKQAFISLFGQDVETFTSTMSLYVDQLEKKLDKDEFQEDGSMPAFWGKALDVDSVVTESSGTESEKHDTSSRSRNDTHAENADIKPVNDKEPMAEVQMTTEYNVLDNEQQHAEQSEFKNKERVDQDAEQCQVKIPLLDPSPNNMTTEFSNQSLESENISLKNTVAQFQKDFSRMKAHCVNLVLKYQNQALKFGQHGQILNETSNKAKIKKEIEVLKTINIELEHIVAKLLAENKKLHQQNEHLKQTYKDLYDSIKNTREKVFTTAALKNELRKLKGNSVDAKLAKPSILRKPVLQPLRNQSVVRQSNAFQFERPKLSKPRFASQVDVKHKLPKPVTPYYFPKVKESVLAKSHHGIAPGDEVFSTWMAFGGNTRDLDSFRERNGRDYELAPRSIVLIAWRRRRKHKATPS